MIGIDLTKIKRFKNLSSRAVEHILAPKEIEVYKTLNKYQKPVFLATRWALKEAIFKVDNRYGNFSSIEITKHESGRYLFKNFNLSTTNDCGFVIAVAYK
ncbi:Holo-[acyl-carrier protein]synthase [Metamycoplasma cloacale]|uniref:ACP synthase n=1 Tax=Metamycoplasma cloacale TaxID=92401 RepID=A0A2Z4LLQ5_9BACT|nr:4'-phosphopantetheinyl transferase superfamily protein [Metamycoplasma cloacale]AWX42639.1 ACP synthase [Metamycoplasma cloacale]VEU79582.1 Holo-[acyl-carrier protein]synthase [Metamycoplasma cloacale]